MSEQKYTLTGPNGSVINIISQNQPMLITALDEIHKEHPSEKEPYLALERGDCKCAFIYKTKADIPEGNHKCEHGNFFIFYTDSIKE
jgi:hypothetical protein